MPNFLDFDNKRAYFRKEIVKQKRHHMHNEINLMIRRNNIFMDAYAQINSIEPDQMKGKFVVKFNNEQG